jgi:probable F420-dependent oxidoreductase
VIPPKPFRFGIQGRTAGPRDEWLEMGPPGRGAGLLHLPGIGPLRPRPRPRRLLDGGGDGDHDIAGSAASSSTTTSATRRAGEGGGDDRRPLRRPVRTRDRAGWLKEEYDQTGIAFDPAPVRIERLTEAVHLIKRIFTEEPPVSFAGTHYTVTDLVCPPRPVQRPHPPFMIGGGGPRLLAVAAREANIVGITTRARRDGSKETTDLTAAATEQKIGWIREAAGDRFADLELNVVGGDVVPTTDVRGEAAKLAARYGVSAEEILGSPQVLIGPPAEMIERLEERRERFGFSYIVVTEPNLEALAPVVARLAGR